MATGVVVEGLQIVADHAEKIAALLLETAPAATGPSTAADAMPTGIAVSDASPALVDAIGRLLALVDTPRDAAALTHGVEREACGG